MAAERILMNEFRVLSLEKWVNIELHKENIFKWDVALIILNKDSLYYGGYFKAVMTFPQNYPYSPPKFKFTQPIYHPNIYDDGEVCISILHKPGEDEMSGETAAERWSPAQRAESVLISILSLLDDPECSSPANVEAGVMLRKNPGCFRQRVMKDVEASKAHIPPGFEMPTERIHIKEMEKKESKESKEDDPYFWAESGAESDAFGGSDSDEEMEFDNSSGTEEEEEEDDEDMTLTLDDQDEEYEEDGDEEEQEEEE